MDVFSPVTILKEFYQDLDLRYREARPPEGGYRGARQNEDCSGGETCGTRPLPHKRVPCSWRYDDNTFQTITNILDDGSKTYTVNVYGYYPPVPTVENRKCIVSVTDTDPADAKYKASREALRILETRYRLVSERARETIF